MAKTLMDMSRSRDPATNITRDEITLDSLRSRKDLEMVAAREMQDRLAQPTLADIPLV